MSNKPSNIDTSTRLDRNLALLHAGSTVNIDISTPAGQRAKFRTTFIGYLPGKYVLIQFPESSKLGKFSQHIVQGTAVTVRGLIEGHEGVVVAFLSTIKQTLQMPSRIMVLDFPRTVGLQNLRSSIRIETQIPAKVKIDEDYWQATIENLSSKGCQLNIMNGEKLVLSDKKDIQIVIEEEQALDNFKLNGSVCNLKQHNDGITFGVKFEEKSEEQVRQLLLTTMTS
ncbi:PilZ domain-containing protein [Colwellia sp. 4_MG-2023]|jgi:c-di-GMP-binding flagellar brake protein YcgR|uniref:PilZ domain-containing protein n=1 Tax=unclassified Colwellia TaxID=196834 RepID=UPI001C087FA5|nr:MULTISPECIES: PilZ domain-containing protein [unclassified Colwellia]MBU2924237.1 flagellar brake protein [Colwellia sp. C2M11]MDO6486918.1 PilZ domain-containing protein [Colwellia sp. 6_MG-2023]MDO6506245.1 PilZ domain-containing protein [Colwellia sp. 5_MG-2023]MDO6554695.1 PilZ domain-containing protein [Colwellia sp. 4_MG-2023]MDO6652102.1 PilZ domain-containing protein [Colwellia sp. 3_MG-2023]